MRILAVDDDPMILEVLRGTLAVAGYAEPTTAACASEAMAALDAAEEPFDCILLDIMMPEVDGITLCGQIRARDDHTATPIIMLTALSGKSHVDRAFAAGATDYLNKPFDGLELGARIRVAAQLSAALRRERAQAEKLAQLESGAPAAGPEPVRSPIEARLALDPAPGLIEYVSMQNYLLKFPAGLYSMRLFTVELAGVEALHARLSGAAFRGAMSAVATAVCAAMEDRKPLLAYAGAGHFAGVIQGRSVPALSDLEARVATAEAAVAQATGEALSLRLSLPSRLTLWTGRRAAEDLDRALGQVREAEAGLGAGGAAPEEDRRDIEDAA